MNVCILMGSPRLHGNTAELVKPFRAELEAGGAHVSYLPLAEYRVHPCRGCYRCQNVAGPYGCCQRDDMDKIVTEILKSDLLVLATPIYTWYCTGEMKAVLDRFYSLGKFYGAVRENFVAGMRVCILATHGYDASYAADPFATGILRMCEHYGMRYEGIFSVRDEDDLASFRTEQAIAGARAFAKRLLASS